MKSLLEEEALIVTAPDDVSFTYTPKPDPPAFLVLAERVLASVKIGLPDVPMVPVPADIIRVVVLMVGPGPTLPSAMLPVPEALRVTVVASPPPMPVISADRAICIDVLLPAVPCKVIAVPCRLVPAS